MASSLDLTRGHICFSRLVRGVAQWPFVKVHGILIALLHACIHRGMMGKLSSNRAAHMSRLMAYERTSETFVGMERLFLQWLHSFH